MGGRCELRGKYGEHLPSRWGVYVWGEVWGLRRPAAASLLATPLQRDVAAPVLYQSPPLCMEQSVHALTGSHIPVPTRPRGCFKFCGMQGNCISPPRISPHTSLPPYLPHTAPIPAASRPLPTHSSAIHSSPSPGCIQVSEATRSLLLSHHTFEDRGGIEVKGKVRSRDKGIQ